METFNNESGERFPFEIKQEDPDRTSAAGTEDHQPGYVETYGPSINSKGYINIKPDGTQEHQPGNEGLFFSGPSMDSADYNIINIKPEESAEGDHLVEPILIVRNVHNIINVTDGSTEVKVEGQGEIKLEGELGIISVCD